MNDSLSLLAWIAGVVVGLEGYGLWLNERDYVLPVKYSARYRATVRTRVLVFAEPRLYRFWQSRYRSVGWTFFFVPLALSWWVLGRSWQTAALGATTAAHLAIMWLAWQQLTSVWREIYALPLDAKQRFLRLRSKRGLQLGVS